MNCIQFQDEMIPGVSKDQEALLISLKRPIVFVQPSAFDKGLQHCCNQKFRVRDALGLVSYPCDCSRKTSNITFSWKVETIFFSKQAIQ